MIFYHFYKKIKTFVTYCFRSRIIQAFQSRVFSKQKEFAPTGANLLLGEHNLYFKSCSLMRLKAKLTIKELLPLKVSSHLKFYLLTNCLFTLSNFYPIQLFLTMMVQLRSELSKLDILQ